MFVGLTKNVIMKKNLFLVGFMACTMAMMGQTQKKENWYFKAGGSYFTQTVASEFPTVSGQPANKDVYVGGKLVSRESVTGSFGEGFRFGGNVGYRFTDRLGVEMGVNYYKSNSKTMVETVDRIVAAGPTYVTGSAVGQIRAFDLAPALVLFLGEVKGFESYTKVGVIVPIHGDLTIETNRKYTNPLGATVTYAKDVVSPNPTMGFMAAIGTSYKLAKNLSAFGEIEYRNFTIHGKTKETKVYTENGVDKLNTATAFRSDASYSASHVNYVDGLNTTSNSTVTNAAGFDNTKATDDISSYVGISGLGLTLGLKYSL